MSTETHDLKAYLLCRYADQSSLYTSWVDQLPFEKRIVEDNPASWRVPDDAGIVITHEHFRWEEVRALRKIVEQARIPSLVLADGILEYRNTWMNPTIPDGSIYQPLFANKIACIGNNSARLIESWGNIGATEVIGIPRLDSHLATVAKDKDPQKFRLLVGTATTPAFTEKQRASVVASLDAVKEWADANPIVSGRELEICWRLTDGLDQEVGIEPIESESKMLDELLAADAAITTPSTIFLESLLVKTPTAILDFSNSPAFVPSAWSITAPQHIEQIIPELANPPEPKLVFQNFILHDNLSCHSPATPRMVELVTRMIEIGHNCRSQHKKLEFPLRILPDPSSPTTGFDSSQLFDGNEAFKESNIARLQAELSQAVARMKTMPQELADKNIQITQLQAALDESRRRVADVRSRLFKLRKILGIGKENQTEEIQENT